MKSKTRDLTFCALLIALITVGAYIKIPIPMLPITLQVMFVILAGLLLGSKRGFISVVVYMILGLIGLPVFTQGGGLMYVLKPSFGYIIGFVVGAFVAGKITEKTSEPSYLRLFAASFAGLMVIYVIGAAYFFMISTLYLGTAISFPTLFLYCFAMVIPGDLVTGVLGVFLAKRLIPWFRLTCEN